MTSKCAASAVIQMCHVKRHTLHCGVISHFMHCTGHLRHRSMTRSTPIISVDTDADPVRAEHKHELQGSATLLKGHVRSWPHSFVVRCIRNKGALLVRCTCEICQNINRLQ
jgi:hypothetical protein